MSRFHTRQRHNHQHQRPLTVIYWPWTQAYGWKWFVLLNYVGRAPILTLLRNILGVDFGSMYAFHFESQNNYVCYVQPFVFTHFIYLIKLVLTTAKDSI